MKKKRICVYCQRWESGGIESFLYNALSRCNMSALEVDLVAEQICNSVFTNRLRDKGVRFIELSGNVRKLRENDRAFQRLLCEREYDVIWLNVYQGMALRYLRLAKHAGVGLRIAHSHNTDLRASRTRWLKLWLHKWAKERYTKDATALWACSAAAAAFMFCSGRDDVQFVANGIETRRFAYDPVERERVRAELELSGQFVIGSIGRLCYQKSQSFALDVFDRLVKEKPESRLLLVGEGEDLPVLQEKAKTLGILDRVIFYGTSDRVERLLWGMDALIFPSRFEGLGIVAVEAQAAGLPVVCSEHIPREAFVTPNIRGLPLDRGAQAWADALLDCVCQEREKAHETVRQAGFDIADVAYDITTFLRKRDK